MFFQLTLSIQRDMKDTEKLLATVVGVLNTLRDKYKIVEKNDDFIKLEMKKHFREQYG